MPVVAVNELGFNLFGSKFLVLISAAITNSWFAPERDDFKVIAFLTFIKIKALADFAAINDLAHFCVHNGANGMNLDKLVPFILKYPLQTYHGTIISEKLTFQKRRSRLFVFLDSFVKNCNPKAGRSPFSYALRKIAKASLTWKVVLVWKALNWNKKEHVKKAKAWFWQERVIVVRF